MYDEMIAFLESIKPWLVHQRYRAKVDDFIAKLHRYKNV